jgi:D-sedoheptulose 7-phosphate isomerase
MVIIEAISELIQRYPILKPIQNDIVNGYKILENCFHNGGKLLVAGYGGSATDAEHIVGELMKSFVINRGLESVFKNRLCEIDAVKGSFLSAHLEDVLPVIALIGNDALNTAFANDVDAELVFAQQLHGYGNPNDVFLAISTSGNSQNIVYAAVTAKAKGIQVLCLTGAGGGELGRYADVAVMVPETETYKVQELHLPIYHSWCLALEKAFFYMKNRCNMPEYNKGCHLVRAVVFDVDGVLTDGKVYMSADDKEMKAYCLKDIDALNDLKQRGYLIACITGEDNYFTDLLKKKLVFDFFYAGCKDKLRKLEEFEKDNGLKAKNVCYIGDGKYDIEAVQHAGVGMCPIDAIQRVKAVADIILNCRGGEGCLEQILSYLT